MKLFSRVIKCSPESEIEIASLWWVQGCGRKENSDLLEAINDKHKAFLINTGNFA